MAIDLKPSDAMATEAERGLRWREEYNRGGTAIGVARARDISNRKNLSPSTVGRMVSYFARHEVDKKGQGFSPGEEGYPSAGRIAWALWGGDSGKSWANEKSRQLKKESINQSFKMELLTIENKAGKVRLNESVNPDSMTRLIEEIGLVFGAKAFADGAVTGEITNCIENAADTLDLEIHSPGGSVLDGYKLYHALLELRGRGVYVTATINSLAASMASVIAMAADKIRMVKGGRMMIHEASQVVAGNAEDLARASKLLDEISGEIADIYAERTGGKREEMRELMKNETWMGADEAMKRKFIDEVVTGKFDTKEKGKSMNILDRLTSPASAEALAEIDTLKAEVSSRETEVAELANKVSVAESALQEAATATAELRNSYATAQAEIETLKAEVAKIPDLEAAAQVAAEKIANEAARLLAASGHPEPIEGLEEKLEQKTMTRAEFNALNPAAKSEFSRTGGRING